MAKFALAERFLDVLEGGSHFPLCSGKVLDFLVHSIENKNKIHLL